MNGICFWVRLQLKYVKVGFEVLMKDGCVLYQATKNQNTSIKLQKASIKFV